MTPLQSWMLMLLTFAIGIVVAYILYKILEELRECERNINYLKRHSHPEYKRRQR